MTVIDVAKLVVGLVLLVVGAESLVRGASKLALTMGISPLVVGLTIVAYGTSAPELAVSTRSSLTAQAGIAIGNVVGSNIFNILVVLGAASLIAPLTVSRQLVKFDVPVAIALSGIILAMGWDGTLARWEGMLLLASWVIYTGVLFALSQRDRQNAAGLDVEDLDTERDLPSTRRSFSGVAIVVGLLMLVGGSTWFVSGAAAIARAAGMSELAVGLTIAAAGTSLPELVTSLVASAKGERDIAVGNVIGSNIFNILAVAGAASAIAPNGLPVPVAAIQFDMPIAIAASLACLPVFLKGQIGRWEGGMFLAYYALYASHLLSAATATAPRANSPVSTAIAVLVVPLTVWVVIRGLRQVPTRSST